MMKEREKMRPDYTNHGMVEEKTEYYIIEEYQSAWNRWVPLTHHYLPEYEFGEFSSCGKCWQDTGVNGCYDYEYAKTYYDKLNQALEDGTLLSHMTDVRRDVASNVVKINKFRICCVRTTYTKQPLE